MHSNQKTISVEEAAYFAGTTKERFRNLVKRGNFSDVAEAVPSCTGNQVRVYIKPAAFMVKYALTWEDIFEARRILQEGVKDGD